MEVRVMQRFIFEAGPYLWPILLLAMVVSILTLINAVDLLVRRHASGEGRRHRIDAVLFWGAMAAMLGFLGQWAGIHKMTTVLVQRGVVSPQAVATGLAESLWTPVVGMMVLVVSGVLWFCLRLGLWESERRSRPGT